MLKQTIFTIILLLLCVTYGWAGMNTIGPWVLLETDVSNDSILLEHKNTGEQRTVYEGDKINDRLGTVKKIKEDSIIVSNDSEGQRYLVEIWVKGSGHGVASPEPVEPKSQSSAKPKSQAAQPEKK